ncbi:MAG: hypothetical protein IIY78_10720 [Clostridia bacterium]|nr:hypothetical protein [Clostridia bacterium]
MVQPELTPLDKDILIAVDYRQVFNGKSYACSVVISEKYPGGRTKYHQILIDEKITFRPGSGINTKGMDKASIAALELIAPKEDKIFNFKYDYSSYIG